MIVVIGNQKGGVGKSTLTVNLATTWQSQGKHVVIVEADPSVFTVSRWSDDREEAGLTPILTIKKTGRLAEALRNLNDQYDMVIVDLPGKDSPEMRSALIVADVFLLPTQPTLLRLQEKHPRIRPRLLVGDTHADLEHEGIDIAIRGGEHALDAPGLIARHLATWTWQICAAPAYLEGHAPILHPAQLHQHRWLHYLPIRTSLNRGPDSHLLQIDDSLACNQLAAVRSLTLAGLGLSLQLTGDTRHLVADGRLRIVLPDWTLPAINVYAVTAHRLQSARTQAAMLLLQRCFAEDHPGSVDR